MSFTTDKNVIKSQIDTRKNILFLYAILGAALITIGLFIDDDIYPASFLYIGAVVIAFIFYVNVSGFVNNPRTSALNSLKIIMYLFIGVFIVGLVVDVVWWEALYYSTFLGAVLAIAGFFIMNQIVSEGKILVGQGPSTFGQSQQQGGVSPQSGDKITQLERLSDLRDKGALTDSEYEKEKAKVLQKFN